MKTDNSVSDTKALLSVTNPIYVALIASPVHNTTQRVNAADARIESKSIPMYTPPA